MNCMLSFAEKIQRPSSASLPQGMQKKCRQGIRGKSGQTTVAPIKAWPGSLAGPPRPLTAVAAKRIPERGATSFLESALQQDLVAQHDQVDRALEGLVQKRSVAALGLHEVRTEGGLLFRIEEHQISRLALLNRGGVQPH